jgi:flavin-dependent dehydrogenase
VLDQILVDAAASAGAELREGVYVDSLLVEDGRVVGIVGHGPDGKEFTERARIVIGADGRNSIVGRSVEAETLVQKPPLSFGYYSYYSGVPCDEAELFLYPGRFAVAFPTNDGLTVVAAGFPFDELNEIRRAPEESFLTALDAIETLGERVRGGRREERLVGMIDIPNFIRRAQGPGWALCGDAAYHKDPGPAEGISDAFRAADTLSDAVHSFLVGGVTEQHAMEGYDRQHYVAAKPLYDATITMGSLDEDPVARATAFLELGGFQQAEYDRLASAEVTEGAA